MGTRITVVDAFTSEPFGGNPAAVAVLDTFPDDRRLQLIAREMNLSETAFVVPIADETFALRWFSPTTEIDLCGHATLASAHVLGGSPRFETRGGTLSCTGSVDGEIEMNFPLDPPTASNSITPAIEGASWSGRARFGILCELADATQVRRYIPDLPAITDLEADALIITAPGDRAGIDCVSRVFAPKLGIAEDPVTGAAHCVLADYWGQRLERQTLVGEQASLRGGVVRMTRAGERVVLAGNAVTIGHLELVV